MNEFYKEEKLSKKKKVLLELHNQCKTRNDYVFNNDLVKDVSKKLGFGNPFNANKIDNKNLLPKYFLENDIAIIHLGNGIHKFIKGIDKVFHDFEPIQKTIEWKYKKSLLNEFNTSESNILSVANNQRILHHFVFGKDKEFDNVDISERPKTYFPHRTKTDFSYRFGDDIQVNFSRIQIEIDLTIEYRGKVAIFEGKTGKPKSFAIYQIYHPFLYYYNANKRLNPSEKIEEIECVYVVKSKENKVTNLKIWAYTFEDPLDITSIKFLRSVCYKLIV